jgi:hypothetical protein
VAGLMVVENLSRAIPSELIMPSRLRGGRAPS